jgi:nucleotide-binding universal stress UspA family protein
MVPPIVIAVHPKRPEPEPIDLGVMLAHLTHAPIDVVSTFWFDPTPHRTAADDYGQTLRDTVQQALDAVGDPRRTSGELRVHVISGSAPDAVHERATRIGAGVIVIGSTHRGAIGRIALGNITDRVLDQARCPVAIAPRGFRGKVVARERVGVAFVDTPGGHAALRAGAAIARHTDASLIAYSVIESHAHATARARAELAVERAIGEHAHDLRSEARVLVDSGLATLVDESQGLDFLVAFGLASKLARQVACPFIVVPPGRDQPLVALFGGVRQAATGADSGGETRVRKRSSGPSTAPSRSRSTSRS